ncbi:hypothetical protein [Oceanicola sp. 502str15]|uniref:hypothetical protein n=1 Tax=Oceanicola sp. 502str15 TaxID=2696061 RepID=UPI002094FA05|nr:hypothetical protein [Oceanicola sp. 502str15]
MILDQLATRGNVAQFVGFRPDGGEPKQSYSRIRGHEPNERFLSTLEALETLLASSADRMINIRSYLPSDPRSREFVYGLTDASEALATLLRLTGEGLHTIANETVDISDGGVSGVLQGRILEFAPDDTPRCVEKPGVASMSFELGMSLLEAVYGFRPDIEAVAGERTEFSIHPRPRGWKGSHTLLWEHENAPDQEVSAEPRWPNRFSRHIGDKAFGLLVASLTGAPVPETLVISRKVAPFRFGKPTGDCEIWTRTCPTEQQPGLFTTVKGWTDPYALLALEDPDGDRIASVIVQSAIRAAHSGAAITSAGGDIVIEGVNGEGDRFMLGERAGGSLPEAVLRDVKALNRRLRSALGPVRFEWVHDGARAWCVQLHVGTSVSDGDVLVPGDVLDWTEFDASNGLSALRELIARMGDGQGILVKGDVGLTSHVADLLRKAGIASRISRKAAFTR